MPPNKLLRPAASAGAAAAAGRWLGALPGVKQLRALAGGGRARPRQRFYPQCQRCSIRQAAAMRNDRRVLVLHLAAPRLRSESLAGASLSRARVCPSFCVCAGC